MAQSSSGIHAQTNSWNLWKCQQLLTRFAWCSIRVIFALLSERRANVSSTTNLRGSRWSPRQLSSWLSREPYVLIFQARLASWVTMIVLAFITLTRRLSHAFLMWFRSPIGCVQIYRSALMALSCIAWIVIASWATLVEIRLQPQKWKPINFSYSISKSAGSIWTRGFERRSSRDLLLCSRETWCLAKTQCWCNNKCSLVMSLNNSQGKLVLHEATWTHPLLWEGSHLRYSHQTDFLSWAKPLQCKPEIRTRTLGSLRLSTQTQLVTTLQTGNRKHRTAVDLEQLIVASTRHRLLTSLSTCHWRIFSPHSNSASRTSRWSQPWIMKLKRLW